MLPQKNPYSNPLELLLQVIQKLSPEEIDRAFSPSGNGIFVQEVVDATRILTTEDLLDSFSFGDSTNYPRPETEEWWAIFQWHPVKKQLISGDDLRRAIKQHLKSTLL